MGKRDKRIKKEIHRLGGPDQGHGWAARRAAKRVNRRGNKRGPGRSKGYRLR